MGTLQAGYEGQTPGTTVTAGGTGNSDAFGDAQIPAAIYTTGGGTMTYSASRVHGGSGSLRVLCNSSASACYFGYPGDAGATGAALREQFYVTLDTMPTASMRLWAATSTSATTMARMQLSTAGVLSLVMTGTSAAAVALAVGQQYRFDIVASGGNSAAGAIDVSIWSGPDDTAVAYATMSLTAQTTSVLFGRTQHGNCSGVNVGAADMTFDDIRTEIGAGPFTAYAPAPGQPVQGGDWLYGSEVRIG